MLLVIRSFAVELVHHLVEVLCLSVFSVLEHLIHELIKLALNGCGLVFKFRILESRFITILVSLLTS